MKWFISFCHDMILSAGCSTNDRDSGMLWPVGETDSQFLYHNVILSAGCSIDDRDSGYVNGQ